MLDLITGWKTLLPQSDDATLVRVLADMERDRLANADDPKMLSIIDESIATIKAEQARRRSQS